MAKGPSRLGIDMTLVRAGERVCVALSGGADSTALLLALVEANCAKEPLGIVLSAAHVHHGLRGVEADDDEAFVSELCARCAVPLHVFRVDTAARQAAYKESIEEAARELRYGMLRGLISQGEVDVVTTAHTLDDQAETVVMKLLRGAWTEGLSGISPVLPVARASSGDARIVRPMLGVRKAEVEIFLRSHGQSWREDSSNRDLSLTRNRARHELMPLLRTFNPAIDSLLARTAEIAREDEAFWAAEAARTLPQVLLPGKPVRGGGRAVTTAVGEASVAIEIARLAAMSPSLRRRVVRAAVKSLYPEAGHAYTLGAEETAKVLALAGLHVIGQTAGPSVKGKIGSRLELHEGLRVMRSARELQFWRQI